MTGAADRRFRFLRRAHAVLALPFRLPLGHDSKTFRETKISAQQGDEWFTRFPPYERFLHFLVVTSFLLLVLTGMPLKFYYTQLGQDDVWIPRRGGSGADPASFRRPHHFPLFWAAPSKLAVRLLEISAASSRAPRAGAASVGVLRMCLFGPDSMIPTCRM